MLLGKTDNDDNTVIVPFNVLTPNLEVSSAQVTDSDGNRAIASFFLVIIPSVQMIRYY
jgi:hypothetical protein